MIPENCSKFHLKKIPFNVISKLEAFISQRKSGFAVIATYKILENRSEWSSQSPIRASVVPHRASLIQGTLKDQQLQGLGTCIPAISQYIPSISTLAPLPLGSLDQLGVPPAPALSFPSLLPPGSIHPLCRLERQTLQSVAWGFTCPPEPTAPI